MDRNPPGHRMAKPNNRLARRLSSVRAGNLETQRDVHRDDVYIDPNRYFTLPNTFGLGRDPWDRLHRAAPNLSEGVQTHAQREGTRQRTRGHAGPNPDEPIGMMGPGVFTPSTDPIGRAKPTGAVKDKRRPKR